MCLLKVLIQFEVIFLELYALPFIGKLAAKTLIMQVSIVKVGAYFIDILD